MHGTRAIAKSETCAIMTSETYCLCFALCPCVMTAEIIMAVLADVP
jgi:hypothetical protein